MWDKNNTMREDSRSVPATLPPPYTSSGTSTASLRRNSHSFTTTTELLIGPKPTRFLLHTHLLTSQSPYFRACLTSTFLESRTQSITLADLSTDHFEYLVQWLYQGTISPPPFKDGKPEYYTLLNLWILADRLCFEGLRNHIIDLIADLADATNSVLTPSDTRILYEGTPESAKIRDLVLDLFAFKKTDKLLATHEDKWHAGFLRDLLTRLKKPCEQAMLRHSLRMWCPMNWRTTRACDVCRVVLHPRYGAVGCDECCLAFCAACIADGVAMAGWEDGRRYNPSSSTSLLCSPSWGRAELPGVREAAGGVRSEGGGTERGGGGGGVFDGGASARPGEPFLGSGMGILQPRYLEGEKTAKLGWWEEKGSERKWEACKPWRGSRCRIYHEHEDTDRCGDVFMGR